MKIGRARSFAGSEPVLLLVGLATPLLFYGLGRYSVVNGDEAIYHAVAVHMLESGDWLQLVFRGAVREYDTFMNAPLQYWVRAGLIALFGDSAWTMRALSAGMGVGSVWMTWRLGVALGDRRAAFCAGVVQLTTFQFVYLHGARTGELESTLCVLLTLCALFLLRALVEHRGFVAHHVCVALLMSIKLPTAVIPLLAGVAVFALVPSARGRARDSLGTALCVLPLGALWHVWNVASDPEAFLRVAGVMAAQASGQAAITGPPGVFENLRFYATALFFGAFPWSIVYPSALAVLVSRARRGETGLRVVGGFILAIAVFYLLIGKRFPWYVISLYPFLSLCVGLWLADLSRARPTGVALAIGSLVASLTVFVSVAATSLNPFAEQASRIAMLPAWRVGPAAGPLLALTATALLWMAARVAANRWPAVRSPGLAVGLGALLLATAGVRVAAPLVHVGHESAVEQLRDELAASRTAGRDIAWPVRVPGSPPPVWIARYYLGEHYELERMKDGSRDELWLRGPLRASRSHDP
ncbi:MAG: glycosyltransferase family 39 protein [Myxococcales bacterium]|nr:glycosyltransferase family 39 protein [Myxococcales bacterium]